MLTWLSTALQRQGEEPSASSIPDAFSNQALACPPLLSRIDVYWVYFPMTLMFLYYQVSALFMPNV